MGIGSTTGFRWLIALGLAFVLLSGCGATRAQVPDFATPLAPVDLGTNAYPGAGLSFRAPRNWTVASGRGTEVAVVASGQAFVAVWRFPQPGPLPSTTAELERARPRLIAAAHARAPALRVINSKVLELAGAGAIELDTLQQIAGQPRRVRSLHVFAYGAEVVLDEYAPPSIFHTVDHQVFSPLKYSLRLFRASTT